MIFLQVADRLQAIATSISGRVKAGTASDVKVDAARAILRIAHGCYNVPEGPGGDSLREEYEGHAPELRLILRHMDVYGKIAVLGEIATVGNELRAYDIEELWHLACKTKDAIWRAGKAEAVRHIHEAYRG